MKRRQSLTRRKLNARKKKTRRTHSRGGMFSPLKQFGKVAGPFAKELLKDATISTVDTLAKREIKSSTLSNSYKARENFGPNGENKPNIYPGNSENINPNGNIPKIQIPIDVPKYYPQTPVVPNNFDSAPKKPPVVPMKPLRM